jgi:hypothetical protein
LCATSATLNWLKHLRKARIGDVKVYEPNFFV